MERFQCGMCELSPPQYAFLPIIGKGSLQPNLLEIIYWYQVGLTKSSEYLIPEPGDAPKEYP